MSKFFLNLEKPDRGGHQWKSTEKLKSSLKKLSVWCVFVFGFLFFYLSQNSNLLFAEAALLDENRCDHQGVKYNLNSSTQTATVAAYKQMPSGTTEWNVVIPDKVSYNSEDYTVTEIGVYVFGSCSGLESVDLSGCTSLESIGRDAFCYCSGLTSVTFPASLTSIGAWAFEGCSGLTSVKIGGKLESFPESVFDGCTSLSEIEITGSKKYFTDNNVVYEITDADNTKAKLILFPIGHKTDESPTTSFVVPKTVSYNGEDYTVTEIGAWAFAYCSGLESIDFSKCTSLTSIGNYAFEDCSGLESIDFSKCTSLTSIGNYAFEDCSGLELVVVSGGDVVLGSYVFCYVDDEYDWQSYDYCTVVFQDSEGKTTLQTQFVFTGAGKPAKAKNPNLKDPNKPGYVFAWKEENTPGNFDFDTQITGDTTLTPSGWNKVVILVKSFEDEYGKMIFKRIFRKGEESGWGRIIESFFNPEAASEMKFKIFHDSTEYAYKDIYFECFYADPDKGVLKVRMQVPAQVSEGTKYKIIQTKSPANTLIVLP